ncbi:hypothetical protein XH96_32780 [Bradyrhizobium sp. CCBAU 51765]|nr:hypothetical protein XH96_32780 [Bradyrhizobium sp. CCBAU 51765]
MSSEQSQVFIEKVRVTKADEERSAADKLIKRFADNLAKAVPKIGARGGQISPPLRLTVAFAPGATTTNMATSLG